MSCCFIYRLFPWSNSSCY
ncbi:MAG: hypothetical protein AB1432_05225 [Bacteroidota bacterium]